MSTDLHVSRSKWASERIKDFDLGIRFCYDAVNFGYARIKNGISRIVNGPPE